MATTDIGRVTPIWRGFYSEATTYELNDIVIDTGGSVWWHKSEELTTGVAPVAGEIWDAVIDMTSFSGLIQSAIVTAQTALAAAQAAVSEVTADTTRAETAATNAENSAAAAATSAAGVGAYAQAAAASATDAAGAATAAAGSATAATGSATAAEGSAVEAESWATGGEDGTPSATNNAKYYSEQAADSATAAAASKSDSEAYAVGKRGGLDVDSEDEAYHNNAAYYAGEAAGSATAAAASAASAAEAVLTGNLAPVYSTSATYSVGDMVLKDGTLYECTTAITTAEFWTAAHWTAVKIAPEVSDLKTHLDEFADDSGIYSNVYIPQFEQGTIAIQNSELAYSDSNLICRIPEGNEIIATTGTTFHLVDPVNFRYRVMYGAYNGNWYSGGDWTTADITVPNATRRYVILIRKVNWGTITPADCDGLVSVVFPYTKVMRDKLAFYKTVSLADLLAYNGAFGIGSGLPYASNNAKVSDYIPVLSGQKIYYSLANNSATDVLVYYNLNRIYVDSVTTGEGVFTVPDDGFIRLCDNNNHNDGYVYFDYQIPDKTRLRIEAIESTYDPTYLVDAVDRITGQLKALSDKGNLVTFGFNTDQHILDDDDATRTLPVLRGLHALSKLTQAYPYDFVCLGGDACDAGAYATSLNLILDECITVQKPLYDAWCPTVPITGNHDAAQNNQNMTGSMLFNAHFKRVANSKFLEGWDATHTNGYWDSAAHKIRFIFFDDTLRTDYTYSERSAALSGMVSGTPEDYNIVIFSHHVISSAVTNTKWGNPLGLQSIINPYANRIICCICGHMHIDISETSDGILYIATTLAMYGYDQDNNRGTLNTETETAFDNFVIDQNNKKIYAFRYGHGADREWTYTLT